MKLVVIEAPAKRETLKKYLGNGYEVFQNLQAAVLTFFGMELDCDDVAAGDRGGEIDHIMTDRRRIGGVVGLNIVGMHEIEEGILRDPLEERIFNIRRNGRICRFSYVGRDPYGEPPSWRLSALCSSW